MLRAVVFNDFASQCPFSYMFGKGNINNGYNCNHPKQEEIVDGGLLYEGDDRS
ncbi:MAG: hypothetical protein NC086_09570 [Alistipes sp.]|nr:hypothetical protein [Alistipes sp.]